jgi:hypothetical protein
MLQTNKKYLTAFGALAKGAINRAGSGVSHVVDPALLPD